MNESRSQFLTDYDLYLWNEGSYHRAWERMGAHLVEVDGSRGTCFAVWAPNARSVSVIGDFNGWDETAHYMNNLGDSGVWERFIPGLFRGKLQVCHPFPVAWIPDRKSRPLRLCLRNSAADGLQGVGYLRIRLGRPRLDGPAELPPESHCPYVLL